MKRQNGGTRGIDRVYRWSWRDHPESRGSAWVTHAAIQQEEADWGCFVVAPNPVSALMRQVSMYAGESS